MTQRRDESTTERLRGDGLLLLFALGCALLVGAWLSRTDTVLWGLALGSFALHDLVVRMHGRRTAPRLAAGAR